MLLYPRRVAREPASNASAGPASTTQEGRKKLRALKDRNTALMEELQRADEEGDKRQKLVRSSSSSSINGGSWLRGGCVRYWSGVIPSDPSAPLVAHPPLSLCGRCTCSVRRRS